MLARLRYYKGYIYPHRWRLVAAVLLGAVAGAASGFGVPYFMQRVFAQFFEATGESFPLYYQILVASLLPAIFIVRGFSFYANQHMLNYIGMDVLRRLRNDLFAQLQRLQMGYFERQKSGDLISRLTSDTNQIQFIVHLISKEGFVQPFIFSGGIGFLAFLSFREREAGFLLLLLAVTPLFLLPVFFIGKHLKHRGRQVQDTLGEVTEVMSENLHAVTEVRAFNLQEREEKRFSEQNSRYLFYYMKMIKYYLISQPLMEVIAVTVLSLAFLYAYQSGLSLSTFLAMGGALYFTIDAVKRLVKVLNDLQRSEGAFVRLEKVLGEQVTISDPVRTERPVTIEGRVCFRDVSFAYGEETALADINVDIKPGTVCALVGPSGAGKSTFAKLIPRFYDVNQGSIEIDGVDVRNWNLQDLRSQVAVVPQMPFLFNDTVANNIRIGRPDASDAEVESAARAAFAHEFIEQLPEAYQTQVGENAVRLSGGQRQRLALARAFLRTAPILILDEATSALDSESELKIQQALEKLVVGRTVFVIAHRFSTIQQADRVLLFESGKITGDGTLPELQNHPIFRKLYENQILH
jgi:ATP-binding cassette, subfamily B, bacterial MsbA